MAEYRFEMDDSGIHDLLNDIAEIPANPWSDLVKKLSDQIPIPLPVLPGAVVRTESGEVFVLAGCGNHWVSQFDPGGEHGWFVSEAMINTYGRITQVLSEGVDL